MTINEKKKIIVECVKNRHKTIKLTRKYCKLLGENFFESEIMQYLFELEYDKIETAIMLIGDTKDKTYGSSLEWFLFDNDCGAKSLTGIVDGIEKEIKTPDDLLWLIG